MKKDRLLLAVLLFFWLAFPSALLASSYEIVPGVELSFTDPPSPWEISTEPPEFLTRERAASLHPQQLAAARKAGFKTPEAAARKMLLDNELFLFNPKTLGHIEVDFSPLKQGENQATAKSLEISARYTAEELYAEEGLEDVKASPSKVNIKGAAAAFRVDAHYRKLDQPTQFIGVITFAREHWIYLYYTGPQGTDEDRAMVNHWLESVKIAVFQE